MSEAAQEPSMGLGTLMSEQLGEESGLLFISAAGPAIERFYHMVHEEYGLDEAQLESLIATFFWQIVGASPIYPRTLYQAGASPAAPTQAETIVVAHGGGDVMRYDLMVFDPGMREDESASTTLEISTTELRQGWSQWRDLRSAQYEMALAQVRRRGRQAESLFERYANFMRLVDYVEPGFAVEAYRAKPFGIVITSPPTLEATGGAGHVCNADIHCPNSVWGVRCQSSGQDSSTVGVVATNKQGIQGVTVALHDLQKSLGTVRAHHTQIEVNGSSGSVFSIDDLYYSDSCFVELPAFTAVNLLRVDGVLCNALPRGQADVTFEGLVSGRVDTHVDAWSPDAPIVFPHSQLKLYTPAVTERGDSGAALIDKNENTLLGFAWWRTGVKEKAQFSVWSWADCVFLAHDLYP